MIYAVATSCNKNEKERREEKKAREKRKNEWTIESECVRFLIGYGAVAGFSSATRNRHIILKSSRIDLKMEP
jgi:hypothetical protein